MSGLLGATTITVERSTITYANGIATRSTPEVLTIEASVQESNQRDLQYLPEGLRSRQLIKVYTRQPLRVGGPADPVTGIIQAHDVLVIDGDTYEVVSTSSWQRMGGGVNHYKAFASRVGNDGGR